MKDRYVFPAFFSYGEGGRIGVVFPDLPGCVSQGDDDEDAMRMAKEALVFHLWGMEEDECAIPPATQARALTPEGDQVVVLVEAFMPPFRERMNNRSVTKTVTVPRWLEVEAKAANLNYSQILQDGIMERLGIQRNVRGRRQKRQSKIPV
ncbi:type II toxin-antitoxin system HicB family antitoxin [Synergistaceae bacterium OttesenSCG-928-I11]|nr:type II toxin-antitoxin system HicB family antitoxin [Synergistaceae bacterium OttesenSCG-928-I11]